MIHKLTNNELYIEIDSFGASLSSIKDIHGTEYLWQGNPEFWKGKAPLLFPIVGALRNGKTIIGGKEYGMPRHGLARIHEFKKTGSGTDSITFMLKSDVETQKIYPFDFSLSVNFELSDTMLTQRFYVTNTGSNIMPFCLGCHPGFNIPLSAEETLTDYVIKFSQSETCDSPVLDPETDLIIGDQRRPVLENTDTLSLSPELFYRDALILETLKSRSVSLYSLETSRGIRMDFDGFDYFGIWQAKNAPFLCLEPWTGTATTNTESDIFEQKRGMTLLKSGESREFILKISIL